MVVIATMLGACVARAPLRVGPAAELENLNRVGERFYCGGEPRSEEAFATLAAMGVRTLLTVDGARPDTQAARRHGMKYVHLPIGYDTISPDRAAQIVKAVRDLDGPFYIHCHHGRHRGVAAAAVAAIATQGWRPEDAVQWMRRTGTSADYAGLFDAVRRFRPPAAAELDALPPAMQFPESVDPPPMREAMVEMDRVWDDLRAASGSERPRHAVLLVEQYRELLRRPETAAHGDAFVERLRRAETEAMRLRDDPTAGSLSAVARSCKECHRHYRN